MILRRNLFRKHRIDGTLKVLVFRLGVSRLARCARHVFRHPFLEHRDIELLGVGADAGGVELGRIETDDGGGQILPRLLIEEGTRHALDDGLGRSAAAVGDDRTARSHGFDGGDAEILFLRIEVGDGVPIESGLLLIAHATREFDVLAGHAPVGLKKGTVAEDLERQARAVEGFDDEVETLVGNKTASGEIIVADGVGDGEFRGLDRRIDDVGIAIIIFPACNIINIMQICLIS